jgi:hypothetical protein
MQTTFFRNHIKIVPLGHKTCCSERKILAELEVPTLVTRKCDVNLAITTLHPTGIPRYCSGKAGRTDGVSVDDEGKVLCL